MKYDYYILQSKDGPDGEWVNRLYSPAEDYVREQVAAIKADTYGAEWKTWRIVWEPSDAERANGYRTEVIARGM